MSIFNQTPSIATYLYAIVAGPYANIESNVTGLPPMKIYYRQSLSSDKPSDEMFKVTQAGMRYYQDLFGIPYQFTKYDQVFVPEFQAGAMENVGCVTFSEKFLFKGEEKTLDKRMNAMITVLHELAHMWFGNLVTMKWWSDLWLNESFATYISYMAMDQIPELSYFKDEWTDFLSRKIKAINEDQRNTTHPIFVNVKNLGDAESVFDGISYGKGASFLKQLYKVLGHETFKTGLKNYFEKFKWKNTELSDFVNTLDQAYNMSPHKTMGKDFNFKSWCDQWLRSSGVNILEPIVEYGENDEILKLSVKQKFE